MASMAGVKALSDYDAGLTGGYLNKAEDCCSGRFGTILFGKSKEESMAWMTPVLVEICIGLEFNGYLPADGYVPPEF